MDTNLSIAHETPPLRHAGLRLAESKPSLENRASLSSLCDTAQGSPAIEPTILERIAAGDKAAVKDCLDTYSDLVWSIARRFLANPADAEDAVQDVFIAIWSAAERFDPAIASEFAFIATIARRRVIDQLRKMGRRPATDSLDGEDAAQSQPAVASFSEESAEIEKVGLVLETLDPMFSEVLSMSLGEGYSHSDIASQLGIPLGTVKTRVRRGLMKVREELQLTA